LEDKNKIVKSKTGIGSRMMQLKVTAGFVGFGALDGLNCDWKS
jgi:hypothetical protein